MGLIFNADQITERNNGLTFDDVLLMPRHCEITSRTIPSLKSRITKNYSCEIPFIAANMDTVTEERMAVAMGEL
jgi:IMP dehydrogenase